MADYTKNEKSVIEAIKHQIKVFNWIELLIIYALLFLVIRFLYVFLNYIPTSSVVIILSVLAGLVVIGTYVTNATSKNAIRKIEEYSNKLNTLLAATRDMREIVYGDLLLENVIDSSLSITGADAASVLLTEGERLVFKMVKGSEISKQTGHSIPKTRGIAGWVLENGSAVRVDDVKIDSRFDSEVDGLTRYETRSVLCVPMRLSSGIIGVMELVNKKAGAFSSEDEELISYFADQVAISIARAKFYEDQKNYEIHLTDILVNAMDSHIPEKRGHSKRIAKYSLLIADAIDMSEDDKTRLYRACLLHDIGFLKMSLKDVLSRDEYKAHSELGYRMLQPINFYADIAPIILHHHERYDGKGYPSGLKGEAIPLEARIIALAEAFDVMVSRDSYKYIGKIIGGGERPPIYSLQRAIEELKNNAGTQFDPELVDVFVNNIKEGSLIE